MEKAQFKVVPGVNSLSDIDDELVKVVRLTVPVIDRLRGLAGGNALARRILMALTNTVGNLLGAAAYLHDHPEDDGHRHLFHAMCGQALHIIADAGATLLGGEEHESGHRVQRDQIVYYHDFDDHTYPAIVTRVVQEEMGFVVLLVFRPDGARINSTNQNFVTPGTTVGQWSPQSS